jgi:hypothetical protein
MTFHPFLTSAAEATLARDQFGMVFVEGTPRVAALATP